MQVLLGCLLLCLVGWGAHGIVNALNLPIPAPLFGLTVLFIFLCVTKRLPKSLALTSQQLLPHISLLFIPTLIGVAAFKAELGQYLWPIVFALSVSTAIGLGVTVYLANCWVKDV